MKKLPGLNALLLLSILLFVSPAFASEVLLSPNGNIRVEIGLEGKESALKYNVSFQLRHPRQLVYPSSLGFTFSEGGEWGRFLDIVSVKRSESKDVISLAAGKFSQAEVQYNELVVTLIEKVNLKRKVDVVFRAYNDGVAFRYIIPKQTEMKKVEILKENTVFDIRDDHVSWPMILPTFTTSYEEFYQKYFLSDINPEFLLAAPLTMKTSDGYYMSLTEAGLKDYAGMYLKKLHGHNNVFTSVLSPLPDKSGVAVRCREDHATPWRLITIANNPGRLIESPVIYSLNDPSVTNDVAWIHPGKCAWSWWTDNKVANASLKSGMNTAVMKYYIDFASEYKLEYLLVDAGWYGMHNDTLADITRSVSELDMQELIAYGKKKHVDLILWINWKNARDQMDKAFPLYARWGVKGVKLDYMDRDDQEMVNFYVKAAKKALENHLLLNMHGAHKPTGLSRTYPNLLTYEAVRGMEYNKWARTTPAHHVTIPYTRMSAGPMDVTPGAFRNVRESEFRSIESMPVVIGTRASQLAMFVVYESPLQSICDNPDAIRGQKGAELLKDVPASWDETKFLQGLIGEYIVLARRKGDKWYIGGLTNESSRNVTIPLGFLPAGRYKVRIFKDDPASSKDPRIINISTAEVMQTEQIQIEMAPGGGFAVELAPLK